MAYTGIYFIGAGKASGKVEVTANNIEEAKSLIELELSKVSQFVSPVSLASVFPTYE